MIQSVEIKGLRGIREGRLAELAPLTVLVGPNSSGKSTILDALLIGGSPLMQAGVSAAAQRRSGLKRGVDWLFWRGSESAIAEVTVEFADTKVVRSFRNESGGRTEATVLSATQREIGADYVGALLRFPIKLDSSGCPLRDSSQLSPLLDVVTDLRLVDPDGAASATPLYELYTDVVRQGRRIAALAIIGEVVPGLVGLEILTEDGAPIVYLVFEDYAVPVAVAGEGVQTLVRTSLELAASPGGVVLLEEPEVHQHPRAIWQTARAIWAAVNRDVQVVLSTHSLDLIDALLSVVSSPADLEKMAVMRLLLEDGQLKSSRITGTQAAEARSTIEEDLR